MLRNSTNPTDIKMAKDLDILTTISLDTCDTHNSMAATAAAAFATVVKDAASLSSFPSKAISDMMSYAEYSDVKPIEVHRAYV